MEPLGTLHMRQAEPWALYLFVAQEPTILSRRKAKAGTLSSLIGYDPTHLKEPAWALDPKTLHLNLKT